MRRASAAPGTDRGGDRPSGRRRWIPFWVLQLAELVVALVFVDISVHVSNGGLLVAAALAFAALAVTAHGPIGLVRICGPWLHMTLLVAVGALVAVAPLVPSLRPDVEGIIVIEFGAIGLIRLATLTEMGPSPRPSWLSRRSVPTVIDATATVTSGTGAGPTAPGKDRTTGSPTGAAARRAGRVVGAASVSGRRAAARHRPAAEEQMRRAVRRAGRFTGRFVSPTERHHRPGSGHQPGD
jgi:hypothetical protein